MFVVIPFVALSIIVFLSGFKCFKFKIRLLNAFVGTAIIIKLVLLIASFKFVVILTFLFSDTTFIGKLTGALILIVSSSLGILTNLLGIRRGYLMGCLLVPTILFYSL